jgi:hypothetical protein
MLEVYGSKHSLFPKICEVEAVGIGAIKSEFLAPYFIASSRKVVEIPASTDGLAHIPDIMLEFTFREWRALET